MKLIKRLFPNLVRQIEIDAVQKLIKECFDEQVHKKHKNFIRVYDDEDGNTWEIIIKFKK